MPISLELLIIAGLILANGFFAAAEIAVLTARRNRLEQQARSAEPLGTKGVGSGVQSGQIPAGGPGGNHADRNAGLGLWRGDAGTAAERLAGGSRFACLPRTTRPLPWRRSSWA